ncbi:MAG: RsmE family RNA methyltransferase [Myxococcota bacterium]
MPHVRLDAPVPVNGTTLLDAATSHHLLRVRRLPRDATFIVSDGEGSLAQAQLIDVRDGRATLRIVGPWSAGPPRPPRHLVWAIPKGPALETGLRMAVEAGVTAIHLALGARSVPRSDRHDRWHRIIASACAQCGRADHPHLDPLWPTLAQAIDQVPEAVQGYIAAPGAGKPALAGEGRAVAIGPEGGFAPHELDHLLDHGWQPLGLGPHVLRSDTAAAIGVARLNQD